MHSKGRVEPSKTSRHPVVRVRVPQILQGGNFQRDTFRKRGGSNCRWLLFPNMLYDRQERNHVIGASPLARERASLHTRAATGFGLVELGHWLILAVSQ